MTPPITGPDDRSPTDEQFAALLDKMASHAKSVGYYDGQDQPDDAAAYRSNVAHCREVLLSALRSARRDAARLDALEESAWKDGNGIALFPGFYTKDKTPFMSLTSLGDQDGSDLGETLVTQPTLRDAIDALSSSPPIREKNDRG